MNEQMLREHDTTCCNHVVSLKCMPWTGIVAGALIAVGLSFLFSIFGAALGLAALQTTPEGVTTLAIGGYLAMIIGTIAIMYFAGWVAGFSGRNHCSNPHLGAIYGITAWCLGLVLMILLATQTSQFLSSNLYTVTNDVATSQLFSSVNTPVVVETINLNPTAKDMQQMNAIDQEEARLLTLSLFLTFALFFIGALSSAMGGYCGIKPCCDVDHSSCRIDTVK